MKKTIIFFLVILSAALFASVLFFPKAQRERITKRDNPADPKATNYQGYETTEAAGKNQSIIILNSSDVSNGFTRTVIISNVGWRPVSYMVSENRDYTGAFWNNMTSPVFSFTVSDVEGWHPIHVLFLLKDNSLTEASNRIYYTLANRAAAPVFSPTAGAYNASQTVLISCTNAGAVIYYTTNGLYPTVNSAKYTAPIIISASLPLKAIAVKDGMADSYCQSGNYYINAVETNFVWVKTFSGTGTEYVDNITFDASNNIFLAGNFDGTADFNPGSGTDNKTSAGFADIFIVKIKSNADYAWTAIIGGSSGEIAQGVAVDNNFNICYAGNFSSSGMDFDPTGGSDLKTANYFDIYISKIGPDVSTYGFTKTFGSNGWDWGYSLAIDCNNNIFVAGDFQNTVDFNADIAVDDHTSLGGWDACITKINSDGSYGWTKTFGSNYNDSAIGIATGQQSNVFIGGSFEGVNVDFDPGAGTDYKSSAGSNDIFLMKLNNDGSYVWTKTFGGTVKDCGYKLAIDAMGNIFLTGFFQDTADFDPGAGTDYKTSAGDCDIFLIKIYSNGDYAWTKTMGGPGEDKGLCIAADKTGNIFIAGSFRDTADFDPGSGVDNKTSEGGRDAFMVKINQDGSYGGVKAFGGTGIYDVAQGVCADNCGNVYLTGNFYNTVNFNPIGGTESVTAAGNADVFLIKYNNF